MLDQDMRQLGSHWVVRPGDPRIELHCLMREVEAVSIFAKAGFSPYALCRDTAVAAQVGLHLVHSLGVHPVDAVSRPDGRSYTVFTHCAYAWKALPAPRQPLHTQLDD